jgi:nucleoid DNA-binding protein
MMENWRQTQHDSEEEQEKERGWESEIHRMGHDFDTLTHWKPEESSFTSYTSGRSFEDPDTFIRSIPDHPTTLLEKETCAEDVLKVWTEVSKFIVEKMKDGYGVKIAGLGTFTYFQDVGEELDGTGKVTSTLRRIPLMILSEFVVRMYELISPFNEKLCQCPTIPLNLTVIADRTKLLRKNVDGIMTEVMQSFARALVCNKNLEFPFPNIGKLQVSNGRAVFKFYANFCSQLDFYHGKPSPNQDQYVLPGVMTPLRLHVPTADFRSVFHLREVRSVHQHELLAPVRKVEGGYEPTRRLGVFGGNPAYTLVEDGSKLTKFKLAHLNGPKLHKRCTVSWVKGKRDYLRPSTEPWPPHRYHVVQSSVVLRPASVSTSNIPPPSAPTSAPVPASPFIPKASSTRPNVPLLNKSEGVEGES